MSDTTEQYRLPNGHWLHQVNPYETDFLFNEIFINDTYNLSSLELAENSTILDIGANIGLFSLFAKEKFPSCRIYAFEPAPEPYQKLVLNLSKFNESVTCYSQGLLDKEQMQDFSYYPGYSVISGCYTDKKKDADVIINGMKSAIATGLIPSVQLETEEKISSLVYQRLSELSVQPCQMTTLSKVIQDNHIETIDLLKIDVESSEVNILMGIAQQDWGKIKRIVMEVHNKADLETIASCLSEQQFKIDVEDDELLKSSGISQITAHR